MFVGEYNSDKRPNGFVRLINQLGNVYEGTITPDCRINGFCISYIARTGMIEIGWYKNNIKHGNWMQIDGDDMMIWDSGNYDNGIRIGEMRNHD